MGRKSLINILVLLAITIVLAIVVIVVPSRRLIKQKAAFGTVNVLLNPPTLSLAVGEEKSVIISLVQTESPRKKISFADIHLDYNKDIIEITNFIPSEKFNVDLIQSGAEFLGGSTGHAKIQAANDTNSPPNDASILLGTIKIKGKASGTSPITIVKDGHNASQIVGDNPNWSPNSGDKGEGLVLAVGTVQNGNYTVGAGGSTTTPLPGPRLSFKVKFQGVDGRPLDDDQYTKRVRVRVVKGDIDKTFDADVTSDDQGKFVGSVVLSGIPVGSGYTLFIKGPLHLARKFCTNNQNERCVEPGTIALVDGNNNFDFSGLVLEGGDLPNPNEEMGQDGVVNSVDYSLWKARYGQTLPENLAIADVDFNGVVDTRDWVLMRNTLETKYKEDY